MSKCAKCSRGISPSRSGLPLYRTLDCSGLGTRQQEALRESCQDCEGPPRRHSIATTGDKDLVMPHAASALDPIDSKKLYRDITTLKKVMKREINNAIKSIDTKSGTLNTQDTMTAMKTAQKLIKKNNAALLNKHNQLQTRMEALEQRVEEMEQEKLTNMIDIYNLPTSEQEDLNSLVTAIAAKLEVSCALEDVKRFPDKKGAGKLQVRLEDEGMKKEWLDRAKVVPITVADVVPGVAGDKGRDVVYISEALTPHNKALLRSARSQLKEHGFKHVWCKGGVIRARRGDEGDSVLIRGEDDIKKLLAKKA